MAQPISEGVLLPAGNRLMSPGLRTKQHADVPPDICERRRHMSFKSCLASAALAVGVLGATAASSTTIDFTTLQLNGNAAATANDLSLTNGGGGRASSAFIKTPISSFDSFTSTFDFTMNQGTNPQADGLTFIIQNA